MNARETISSAIGGAKAWNSVLFEQGPPYPADKKPQVRALQTLLYELGFGETLGWAGTADGCHGKKTAAAVRLFARKNNLRSNGAKVNRRVAERIVAKHDLLQSFRALASDIAGNSPRTLQKLMNQALGLDLEEQDSFSSSPTGAQTTQQAVIAYAEKRTKKPKDYALKNCKPYVLDELRNELQSHYGKHWLSPEAALQLTTPTDKVTTDEDEGSTALDGKSGNSSSTTKSKGMKDHTTMSDTTSDDPVKGGATPGAATKDGAERRNGKASSERDFSVSSGITARLLDVKPVGQELENWCWAASTQMMVGYLRSLGETECPTCGRSGHHDEDITQARQMNRRLGDSEVDCSIERTAGYDYKTCDRGGWPHFFEFQDQIQSTEWASKRNVLEDHGLVLRDGGPRLRMRRRLSDWQLKALAHNSGREFWKRLEDAEGAALSWEMLTHLLDHQRPVAFTFRYPEPTAGHMRLAVGYVITPGNKRWVAVADPLPPGTGEVHLIPYEFYRDGPFDGHWRDYWVPPAAKDGSTGGHRCEHKRIEVGRELVASHITYPEDPSPPKPKTDGEKLSDKDCAAAFLEAQEGLRAVEAIVAEAKPMAADLGMGAAWARVIAKMMADGAASDEEQAYIQTEFQTDFVIRDLKPGERLELSKTDLIPVYELTTKELRDWDATGSSAEKVLGLLDRPREIIFAITRPDQAPLTFFAAVTVRRKRDRWTLSSLGRDSLMEFFVGKQFDRALESAFLGEGGAGAGAFGMLHLRLLQQFAETKDRFRRYVEENPPIDGLTATEDSRKKFQGDMEREIQRAIDQGEESSKEQDKERVRQLEELRKKLKTDAPGYPRALWTDRDELEKLWAKRAKDDPKENRLKELKEWSDAWTEFWRTARDKKLRTAFVQLLEEGSPQVLQGILRNLYPTTLRYLDEGYYRTKESLLHLVEREEQLEELCEEWSNTKGRRKREEILEQIFETSRDQEIEWLQRWSRLSKRGETQLESLKEQRGLDGGYAKPKYILSVPGLYQLLVAYAPDHVTTTADPHLEDEVFPVYEKSFHRPERRVPKGNLLEVLKDLQDVANERKVMRRG